MKQTVIFIQRFREILLYGNTTVILKPYTNIILQLNGMTIT